jgi:hypothetical protein
LFGSLFNSTTACTTAWRREREEERRAEVEELGAGAALPVKMCAAIVYIGCMRV